MGELDPQSYTILARQALRNTYQPRLGETLSSFEKGVIETLSILIKALQEITDDIDVEDDHKEDDKNLEGLDSLYIDVFGRQPPKTSPDFIISFPEIGLSIEDIWPDGDAPDDPNINDVIDVMKKSFSPSDVAQDWNLIDSLYVNGVEWDGS